MARLSAWPPMLCVVTMDLSLVPPAWAGRVCVLRRRSRNKCPKEMSFVSQRILALPRAILGLSAWRATHCRGFNRARELQSQAALSSDLSVTDAPAA